MYLFRNYYKQAKQDYKRLLNAQLIIIDDIILLPVSKPDAAKLFGLINMLYERCSFIITTNKSPQEWVEMLDDEVLATALLDAWIQVFSVKCLIDS